MTTKLNHPDDIGFNRDACWRGSFKAGAAWMFLVWATDFPGICLVAVHPEWALMLRTAIAVVPLIFAILYVRAVARWIRGMDEMHRALSFESFAFATVAYLLLGTAWFLFNQAGVWMALARATNIHLEKIPWNNCTFIISMVYVLFGIGYTIFKRRYQ